MAVYSTSSKARPIIHPGTGPGAAPSIEIDLVAITVPTAELVFSEPTISLLPTEGTVADIKVSLPAIRQGEDKTYRFTAFTSPGQARNLTGEVVHISFKKRRDDTVEVLDKDSNTATDVNVVDAANGVFDLLIDTTESAVLTAGIVYEGDVFIVDGSGERIHYGELCLPAVASAVTF